MKKVLFCISALCVLLSCNREAPVAPFEDVCIVAGRSADDGDIKSSYFGTGSLVWSYGDKISIFDGTGNREFITYSQANSSTAEFRGQISSAWKTLVGVYPYNKDNALLDDGNVTVNFSPVQIAAPGGFTDGSNTAVGKTGTKSSLQMKNACAYIKLGFTSSKDVRIIYLAPNAKGVNICGKMTVNPEDAGLTSSNEGGNCISIVPDGSVIAPGTYYIAAAPVRLDKGFRVFFKMADGKLLCKTGSKTARLYRNRTLDIGTIDVDKLPVATEECMNQTVLQIDFSTASSAFVETLPKSKETGETVYHTKSGNYPIVISVTPVEEGGNSRGAGWFHKDKYLALFANNFYQNGNNEYLDGITLPEIPGKCLVKVEVVAPSATFPVNVTNYDCSVGYYDEDYDTKPATKYNSNGNWLGGTYRFNLPLSTSTDPYRIVARVKSSFCYISKINLYYETINPGSVPADAEPDPDNTNPSWDNMGFEPIADGGNLL